MKIADSIRRAGRSLKNAKGRTILTSLAIAVGAFTLTAALAAGTGARQYADKLVKSNVDPQSIFVAKDPFLFGGGGGPNGGLKEYSINATQYGGATFKALSQTDIDLMSKTEGVESVAPMYLVSAQYVQFEGIDKKYTTDITAYDASVKAETAAGNLPALGRQLDENDIVLPESYAETLKMKPADMIGKNVTLRVNKASNPPTEEQIQAAFFSGGTAAIEQLVTAESRDVTYTVRAVSAKSSTSFSASAALFISDIAAKELSEYITSGTDQYQKYITATVRVKDGKDPKKVKEAFKTTYDNAKNAEYITAKTAEDLQNLLFTIVNVIQGIVLVFGVLALIASVFGIINTQYISVLERTREIGLMKALGMRGRHVRRLFQYEAAWIGALGGTLGALLAWGVGTALNPWISTLLSIGENRILVFEFLPIFGLVIALMLVAMLAGWFPARKAAKLNPIDALRTE